MPSNELKWTTAQKLAIETTDSDVLVTASAGTGKTAVLAQRCVRILADQQNPTDVSQILVLTFTEASAEEMTQRIAAQLADEIEAEKLRAGHYKSEIVGIANTSQYRRLSKARYRVRLALIPLAILLGFGALTLLFHIGEQVVTSAIFWSLGPIFSVAAWTLLELVRPFLLSEHRLLHDFEIDLKDKENKLRESEMHLRELGENSDDW